jgi:hypothetical protein
MAIKVVRAKKTNIVNLTGNVVEIISVQAKKSDTNYFFNVLNYSFTGNQIIAKAVYDEIKVQYEDGVKSEFQSGLEKNALNNQALIFGSTINISQFTQASNTAQKQRNSVEVSKNGSVLGTNVGGLVSLAENAQERITTTDEPVLSVLTDTISNVSLAQTSSSKNDITTLTGKTTSDGFLNATVTTGSPSGLNNALTGANVPAERRRDVLKESSTEPDTVESVTETTNPFQTITNLFSKQRDVTVRKQNNAIGNPLGSFKLGNLGGFGVGPVGIPNTNMLGSLVGKLLGVSIPSIPGVPTPSLPSGVTVPTGVTPPPNIVESTGQTNINKVVKTPTVISPTVRNTVEPRNVSKDPGFQGAPSSEKGSSYRFDYIGGPEELKSEIINTTRSITTMVVHWSRTYTNYDWGSKEVGELHTSWQIENFPEGADPVSSLVKLGVNSGLQFHYVIKRNGAIQIGRPINIIAPLFTGFGKHALHVGFVGGFNCPSETPNKEQFLSSDSFTPEQWKSFDEIVKAFDAAKNGAGEFVGFNQFTKYGMLGPGFNVPEYVQSKFNKSTVYTLDDFNRSDALSPQEIVTRRPQKPVVNPIPPNNPPPTPIVTEVPVPGVPSQNEIDARNTEYNAAVKERDRIQSESKIFIDEFEKLQADPSVSTTTIEAKENEYYNDVYPKTRAAINKVQQLKTKFMNDDYLYVDKESKWIHGSQKNEYFD